MRESISPVPFGPFKRSEFLPCVKHEWNEWVGQSIGAPVSKEATLSGCLPDQGHRDAVSDVLREFLAFFVPIKRINDRG